MAFYQYKAVSPAGEVQEGVLEWNKAFEKAGFENAVQAKIQPDDADFDTSTASVRPRQVVMVRDGGLATSSPLGRTWRIARAEYDHNRGWLAYADRRRYFADGKYGGTDAAKRAARWVGPLNRIVAGGPETSLGASAGMRKSETTTSSLMRIGV